MAMLATACADDPAPMASAAPAAAAPAPQPRAVVEVVSTTVALPPLDPDARPTTPLGELRAAHLPIWSPDFDGAFPPEVCGSAWELDAIAEPTTGANLVVLGDGLAAAALSVMRYEHLVSSALADPAVVGQLCVAVAAVGSARSDALDLLATRVVTGAHEGTSPTYPAEVTIVAAAPAELLAVACTAPGRVGASAEEGEPAGDPSQARLGAYLLTVSRGLEDAILDISYRVSDVSYRSAGSCAELPRWADEWDQRAEHWAVSGEIWGVVGRTVTVDVLCDSPPPDGPDECPREWSP